MTAAADNRDEARHNLANGKPAMLWRRLIADTETPVGAALKLFEPGRGDFLLESVEGGETRGRYSLIGLDPDLIFRATGGRCSVNRVWQENRDSFEDLPGDSLVELRAMAESCRLDLPPALPRVLACLVGYFGYETIGLVERLPRAPDSELSLPDMLFVRPTILLVFDRLSDALFCIAPLWPGQTSPEKAVAIAQDRIEETLRRLARPVAESASQAVDIQPALSPTIPAENYRSMVLRAKEYIEAGDVFQVVLAQRFTCPFPLPPISLYRSLRRVNPSPFLYFLDLPGFALIGSSPEILVRVRDGDVTIRPIAGTRPRGKTPQEDKANEASLLADPKERAEHLMLLDLGRNDVGRVAKAGTVEVTESYAIERYSHVMHMVSNVEGKLDTDRHDSIDAVFAGFPAGTVSGAPKVRACEIIAELEPETRGAYAGGVGYFAPDGSVDSCIVLRTAVVKDGVMHVQAGAGIVADSDPDYEQRECEAKTGALLAAAIEAIRVAGEPGYGQ